MSDKIAAVGNGRIILTTASDGSWRLPLEEEVTVAPGAYSFSFPGFKAIATADIEPAAETALHNFGLREAWGMIPQDEYAGAAKGTELINWHLETRFCPACGTPLERALEISKKCPECQREYFPTLFPAIVVLVMDGEKALLVHAKSLRKGVHALVAGFVETGETLEECVAREVKEEADLDICDIRYFGSQSWPFPHQLMIGFTARLKKGSVRFADGELDSGGFFTRDQHPLLPSPPSLTRRLIDAWLSHSL